MKKTNIRNCQSPILFDIGIFKLPIVIVSTLIEKVFVQLDNLYIHYNSLWYCKEGCKQNSSLNLHCAILRVT